MSDPTSATSNSGCQMSLGTMKTSRSADHINQIIQKYLHRHSIPDYSSSWIAKKSELDGFGIFANRDIDAGEIIFIDRPVIWGPRAGLKECNFCINCFAEQKNLANCAKKCGLKVCSPKCQQSDNHQKVCKIISQWVNADSDLEQMSTKMMKCLTPIRSLLLSNKDKMVIEHLKTHERINYDVEVQIMKEEMKLNIKEDEEKFMRFVCAALHDNAFETATSSDNKQSLLRGLYPLAGLINHCCVPNAYFVYDGDRKMVARASVFIPKGQEIFYCYNRVIWSTMTRRYHLYKTKYFICKCKRCSDPSELKSYISALRCVECKGNVLPIDTFEMNTKWQCDNCKVVVDETFVATRMSVLGSIMDTFSDSNIEFIFKILFNKLSSLVADNNQVMLMTEYKLIWIIGYSENFKWEALSADLLTMKEQMCKHILSVLETLGTGWTKMRGLLLYELYCCMLWRKRINSKQDLSHTYTSTMEEYLAEAAEILHFDVGAPDEIKRYWKNKNSLTEGEHLGAKFSLVIQSK